MVGVVDGRGDTRLALLKWNTLSHETDNGFDGGVFSLSCSQLLLLLLLLLRLLLLRLLLLERLSMLLKALWLNDCDDDDVLYITLRGLWCRLVPSRGVNWLVGVTEVDEGAD